MEKNLWKFHLLLMLTWSLYLKKWVTCHNNPKESSTTKITKHAPSGYSLFKHFSFDNTKNNLDYYRGQDMQMSMQQK